MSDTPETDLEDDLYLECASPCIVKESTGAIFTGDFVPAEFARRLERERDELRRLWEAECAESRKLEQDREYNAELLAEAWKDAAMWKANHDNQVELKSIISKRGDLRDRAPRVEKLIAERDQLRDAVKWALGESGDFGSRPKAVGAYWWREELRKRAGI